MREPDLSAFMTLFREAYTRCFGQPLAQPLTEAESRRLSSEIEEQTGLVIGWKSLKNYAAFALDPATGKAVNPSIATLDTLARYVAGAPATTENLRKKTEAHYPYWFQYQARHGESPPKAEPARPRAGSRGRWVIIAGLGLFLLLLAVLAGAYLRSPRPAVVVDDFSSVIEDDLRSRGWFLQAREPRYWNRRGERDSSLTLFTLPGDNWPQTGETPIIRNLLLRKISSGDFSAEVHFRDFIPAENWQQAGLLLLEDTTFTGKSLRLSLAYNDFFGGYDKPAEILIQAIAAYGRDHPNLEEIAHHPLFTLEPNRTGPLIRDNLQHAAVRIEKRGGRFRLLYAASPTENFSFRELTVHEFDMRPRYVGIFALKGFVDSTAVVPVRVRYFRLEE